MSIIRKVIKEGIEPTTVTEVQRTPLGCLPPQSSGELEIGGIKHGIYKSSRNVRPDLDGKVMPQSMYDLIRQSEVTQEHERPMLLEDVDDGEFILLHTDTRVGPYFKLKEEGAEYMEYAKVTLLKGVRFVEALKEPIPLIRAARGSYVRIDIGGLSSTFIVSGEHDVGGAPNYNVMVPIEPYGNTPDFIDRAPENTMCRPIGREYGTWSDIPIGASFVAGSILEIPLIKKGPKTILNGEGETFDCIPNPPYIEVSIDVTDFEVIGNANLSEITS